MLTETKKVRYFRKPQLVEACYEAIRTNRNRAPSDRCLEYLGTHEEIRLYPVSWSMIHNDVEMRVQVVLDEGGSTLWLDIPFETWDALGEAEIPSDH